MKYRPYEVTTAAGETRLINGASPAQIRAHLTTGVEIKPANGARVIAWLAQGVRSEPVPADKPKTEAPATGSAAA